MNQYVSIGTIPFRENASIILDNCMIIKGIGHFDFEDLLQQLSQTPVDENGKMLGFPVPDGDIGGGDMTGVEADAVKEAIYQRLIPFETATIIHAGPLPGQEENYKQALRQAITAGAPFINQAIDVQNTTWGQKREELTMTGKPADKIPQDIPHAFDLDLGQAVLSQPWREGVWGPMDKNTPWQYDQYGIPKLRIGNRDKENVDAESWNRPYHDGLKELRGAQGHTGDTKEFIESHKVQPNSVYVNIEAYKHIKDMIKTMTMQGIPLSPDSLRNQWVNHPVLRNHLPHEMTPVQYHYGLRHQNSPAVAPVADVAQEQVEAQQSPTHADYFQPEDLQSKKGTDMVANARANWGHYGPHLLAAMGKKYDMEGLDMADVQSRGKGGHNVDRLLSGFASLLGARPPQTEPQPTPIPPPEHLPTPVPTEVPVPQPQAPPVQQRPPPPPVQQREPVVAPPPVRGEMPPNPPQMPPSHLNTNQGEQPPAPQPDELGGWRGMARELGYRVGQGVGTVGRWLTKEEIENALESVQHEMALQDETITKLLPHIAMNGDNASDIAMMAGQIQRPASDVVAVLNSRGDWRELSKSMDMPFDYIQLVKVAFNG